MRERFNVGPAGDLAGTFDEMTAETLDGAIATLEFRLSLPPGPPTGPPSTSPAPPGTKTYVVVRVSRG